MSGDALGILGIVVSVVLFLLSYRQTVGATKERMRVANAEVESICVKRVVLEKYPLTLADVERLLDGKARDQRVRIASLLSAEQVATTVYTRVMESDLIPAEQRQEIVGRLNPLLNPSDAALARERDVGSSFRADRKGQAAQIVSAVLALIASAIGGVVAAFPDLQRFSISKPEALETIAGVGAMSLAVIMLVLVLLR